MSDLFLRFKLLDLASSGLRQLESRFSKLDEQGKALSRTWTQAKKDMAVGVASLGAAKATWSQAVKPGIDAAARLEAAMLKAEAALTTKGKAVAEVRKELDAFKRTALDVGNPLPLSVADVVAAETGLVKAGLKVEDVGGSQGAAASASFLAVLEQADPQQMAEAIGDIGNQFKLAGAQYWGLANNLSKGSDAASTSITELAEALKFVGGSAKRLGVSDRETIALLAAQSNVGQKGSMAGTGLESFLNKLAVPASDEASRIQERLGLNFFSGQGKFVGITAALDQLRKAESGLTQKQRETVRFKLFGEQGGRVAAAFLDDPKAIEAVVQAMGEQLDIGKKVEIQLKGHEGQLEALRGTLTSMLADGFTPMLEVLTAAERRANGLVGTLSRFQTENPEVNTAVSAGAGAVVGAGALFGAYKLARGGTGAVRAGLGALGRGGVLSVGAGLAAGKAVEELGGVQPVFVTNWPGRGVGGLGGGGGGGLAADAAGAAAGAGGAGFLAKTWRAGKLALAGAPLLGLMEAGAAATATATVGAAAAAGAAGYGATRLALAGLGLDESIQKGMASALAAMGLETGKRALADIERSTPQVNLSVHVDKSGQVTVGGGPLDAPRMQVRRGVMR